jgi:hypothetical protein
LPAKFKQQRMLEGARTRNREVRNRGGTIATIHTLYGQGGMTRRTIECLAANSHRATVSTVILQSSAKLEDGTRDQNADVRRSNEHSHHKSVFLTRCRFHLSVRINRGNMTPKRQSPEVSWPSGPYLPKRGCQEILRWHRSPVIQLILQMCRSPGSIHKKCRADIDFTITGGTIRAPRTTEWLCNSKEPFRRMTPTRND